MTDIISVTKKQAPEIIDKSQLATRAGASKVPCDDIYSPNYDLTEAGFLRRNKNWMDFSERFRENIKADAKRININMVAKAEEARRARNKPLTNSAPKT